MGVSELDHTQVSELGRRICAALLSCQTGAGMDFCYRRYVLTRGELGGLWYDIAEQALLALHRAGRRLPSPPPARPVAPRGSRAAAIRPP